MPHVKIRRVGKCTRCGRKTAFTSDKNICRTCERVVEEQKQNLKTKIQENINKIFVSQQEQMQQKEETEYLELKQQPIVEPIVEPIIKPIKQEEEIESKLPEDVLNATQDTKYFTIETINLPEIKHTEKTEEQKVKKYIDFGRCKGCGVEIKTAANIIRGSNYCDNCFQKELEESEYYIVRLATEKDVYRTNKCCEIWMHGDKNKRLSILRKTLKSKNNFIIIALVNKDVVGFMGWKLIKEWTTTYTRLISLGIFIIPKHRHKGLLTKMWRATLKELGDKFELCLVDTVQEYPKYLGFTPSKMTLWVFALDKEKKNIEYDKVDQV